MSELDEFVTTTLPRQIKAEEAIHDGDVRPRLEMWSTEDPVTLFGAAGGFNSGRDELSRTFERVASQFSNFTEYDFELVAAGVSGDLAYTVGYERFSVSIDGGPAGPNTLRVTHVYRREHGEWKIVHRHGDHPPVDKSPPTGGPNLAEASRPAQARDAPTARATTAAAPPRASRAWLGVRIGQRVGQVAVLRLMGDSAITPALIRKASAKTLSASTSEASMSRPPA